MIERMCCSREAGWSYILELVVVVVEAGMTMEVWIECSVQVIGAGVA